jgi:hypothetical protein
MTIIDLKTALKQRGDQRLLAEDRNSDAYDRARQRAQELIIFLNEKCEPNDAIAPHAKPDSLLNDISEIFYESERRRERNS